MDELEQDIKALIIEVLKLEDLRLEDIDSDEMLFGEGLGLDSIDALEIGVALRQRYGLKIDTITAEVKAHFKSVRSLAKFVRMQSEGRSDAVA